MLYTIEPGMVIKNQEVSFSSNEVSFDTQEVVNGFFNKKEIDEYVSGLGKKLPTPEELTNILCFDESLISFFYDKTFICTSSFEDKFYMIKGFLSRKDFSFESCFFSDKDRIGENVYVIPVTSEIKSYLDMNSASILLSKINFSDYKLDPSGSGITEFFFDSNMTKNINFSDQNRYAYKDNIFFEYEDIKVCLKNYDSEKNRKVPNVYADQNSGSIIGIDGTMEWDINGYYEQYDSAFNIFHGNIVVKVRYIGEIDFASVVFSNGKKNIAPTMVSKNERNNSIEFSENNVQFRIKESSYYGENLEWIDFAGNVFYGNTKVEFRIKPLEDEISEVLEVEFFASNAPVVEFDYQNRKFSCPDSDILYYKMPSYPDFIKFDNPLISDDFENNIEFKFLDSGSVSYFVPRKKKYIIGSGYRIFRGTEMSITLQGKAIDGTKTEEFVFEEMYEKNIRENSVFDFQNDKVLINFSRGNLGVYGIKVDVNSVTQKELYDFRSSNSATIPVLLVEGKVNLVEVYYKEYNDEEFSLWKSQEVRVRQTINQFDMIYNDHIDAGTVKLTGFKKNGNYSFLVGGAETIFTVENYSTHEEIVSLPNGMDPDSVFNGGLKLNGDYPDLDSDINYKTYRINSYPFAGLQEAYVFETVNGEEIRTLKKNIVFFREIQDKYSIYVKMLYKKDMEGYDGELEVIDEGDSSKFTGKNVEDLGAVKGQFTRAMDYYIYAYSYNPTTSERGPWSKFNMGKMSQNYIDRKHMIVGIREESKFDNNYKDDFSDEMQNSFIFSSDKIIMNLNTYFKPGKMSENFYLDIKNVNGTVLGTEEVPLGGKIALDVSYLKNKIYLGATQSFDLEFYYKNLAGNRVSILNTDIRITKPLFGMASGLFFGDDGASVQEIVVAVMPYSETLIDGGVRNSEIMGLILDSPMNYGARYWESGTPKYDSYINHKEFIMSPDGIINDVRSNKLSGSLGEFGWTTYRFSQENSSVKVGPFTAKELSISGTLYNVDSSTGTEFAAANKNIKCSINFPNGVGADETLDSSTDSEGKYIFSKTVFNNSPYDQTIEMMVYTNYEVPSKYRTIIPGDGTIIYGEGQFIEKLDYETARKFSNLTNNIKKIGITDTILKQKEFGDDGFNGYRYMGYGFRNVSTGTSYGGDGSQTSYQTCSASIYDRIQYRPIYKNFKDTPGAMVPLYCLDFGTEEFEIRELNGKKFLIYKNIGVGNTSERAISSRVEGAFQDFPDDGRHLLDRDDGGFRKPVGFDIRNILCMYAADAGGNVSIHSNQVTMQKKGNFLAKCFNTSNYGAALNESIDSLVELAAADLERND